MILFELFQTESNTLYQDLQVSNNSRQYDFLLSIISIACKAKKEFLSQTVIKALNYHAITCLHTNPGEYRPCEVVVGSHQPPAHYRVQALMDDFVNDVNRYWEKFDPPLLATYVLWRLNYIHPFINGNGRTARAAAYFVLCVRSGGLLDGTVILPELIRARRPEYVTALEVAHASFAAGSVDLRPLHALIVELIDQQIKSAIPSASP